MADIHGRFIEFQKMLEKIHFSPVSDKLIIIGDIIDRGPYPLELIKYCYDNQDSVILLRGNHEQFLIEYYKEDSGPWSRFEAWQDWRANGGDVTRGQLEDLRNYGSEEAFHNYISFINETKLYMIVQCSGTKYFLSHAGLFLYSNAETFEDQIKLNCSGDYYPILWNRKPYFFQPNNSGYVMIHGHTPTPLMAQYIYTHFNVPTDQQTITERPEITSYDDDRKINIDCACAAGDGIGVLGCLRLEDMKEFYVPCEREPTN